MVRITAVCPVTAFDHIPASSFMLLNVHLLPPQLTFYSVATCSAQCSRVQELGESRGGRLGLPVPDSPYGLCGRKAALNLNRGFAMLSCKLSLKLQALVYDILPKVPESDVRSVTQPATVTFPQALDLTATWRSCIVLVCVGGQLLYIEI